MSKINRIQVRELRDMEMNFLLDGGTLILDSGFSIVPVYKNRRGHPGLFPKRCADEIFHGVNLREIVNKDTSRIDFVEVHDEGIILDMDTPEDYGTITRHIEKNIMERMKHDKTRGS